MQQAECAHSAPETRASSGNINETSAATRRGLIGLMVAAGTISVAASALTSTGSPLEVHWGNLKAGYAAMKASTSEDDAPLWAQIDAASSAIHQGRARTAREAEICLWCGLLHNGLADPRIEEMVLSENLDALSSAADDKRLDYEYLFFVRSLEGQRRGQAQGRLS